MARILFLQDMFSEYLGTLSVCAYLKQYGHQPSVAVARTPRVIRRELREVNPHAVGLYCSIGNLGWVKEAIRIIRGAGDSGPVILLGGPHATFFPEIIEQWPVDAVCVGEGEEAVTELADRLDSGDGFDDLANFRVRRSDGSIACNPVRPLVENLDQLPPPDRSLYGRYPFLARAATKIFMTGRGCPYRCSFCMNRAYNEIYRGKGRVVRKRSPDHVVQEILAVRSEWGLEFVRFVDDTLVMDKEWLFDFLALYRREVGLPFSCTMRADTADREMVRELGRSGAHACFFGLESGVERLRNTVLNKDIHNEDIRRVAGWLGEEGIRILTFNMLGLPGETLEDAFETVKLNREIGTSYPWCSLLQPYPGTDLERYCFEAGTLEPVAAEGAKFDASWFRASILAQPRIRQIENLQKFFLFAVRFPRLEPLIRGLIRLPPNPLFHAVFMAGYGYLFARSRRLSLWRLVATALHVGRHY